MRACVRACVRVCVRACVRVTEYVKSGIKVGSNFDYLYPWTERSDLIKILVDSMDSRT